MNVKTAEAIASAIRIMCESTARIENIEMDSNKCNSSEWRKVKTRDIQNVKAAEQIIVTALTTQ